MPTAGEAAPWAKERFAADGVYLHPSPIIPADVLREAADAASEVLGGTFRDGTPFNLMPFDPGRKVQLLKLEMPQVAHSAIMKLVSHPNLGRLAAQLLDAAMVQVWWVQLVDKPPSDPSTGEEFHIGWHRDAQYWRPWEDDSELFTAWIPLGEASPRSGTLRFIRGSHRIDPRRIGNFLRQDADAHLREILCDDVPTDIIEATLPLGGVSFHHKWTVHGSGPNLTDQPRRALGIHLRTERSRPRPFRCGSTQFIDDPNYSPVIHRA